VRFKATELDEWYRGAPLGVSFFTPIVSRPCLQPPQMKRVSPPSMTNAFASAGNACEEQKDEDVGDIDFTLRPRLASVAFDGGYMGLAL